MKELTRRAFTQGAIASATAAAVCSAIRPYSAAAALDLDAEAIGSGQDPMVTADQATGAVYISWIVPATSATPTTQVLLARSFDGGLTFGDPVVASGDDPDVISYVGSSPIVRLGPGGEVYVVYQENRAHPGISFGRDVLRVARSTDGGATFGPAADVFAQMEGVEAGNFHDAIVAPEGAVYLAWLSYRQFMPENGFGADGVVEVRVTRSDDGGATFGTNVLVDDLSCDCCRTAFALGGDGTLYLAWRDREPQEDGGDPVRNTVVARSTDRGDTWSAPIPIHDDGWRVAFCPESGPEIAIDSTGRLRAAWFTGKEGGAGVYYAASEDGGATFSEPVALATDEYFPHANVRMDLDGEDNAWVTWDDRRTADGAVQLVRVGADGAVTPLLDEALAGLTADIAVGSAGAVVVWLAQDEIRAASIPTGDQG